jgi:hypothetical protein
VEIFLELEIRKTGEILRMRRVRDSQGQTILALDGSLPAQLETKRFLFRPGGPQSYPLGSFINGGTPEMIY